MWCVVVWWPTIADVAAVLECSVQIANVHGEIVVCLCLSFFWAAAKVS